VRLDDFDCRCSNFGIDAVGQFYKLLTGGIHGVPVTLDFIIYIVRANAVFNDIEFVALSQMDTPDRNSGRNGMSFQGQAH
jgi:hypothetical protein